MVLTINLKCLSYYCLLISLFFLHFQYTSSVKNTANIELTPTVKVKTSLNVCSKCKVDSFANRIMDSNKDIQTLMTCNGFVYSEMPYSFTLFNGKLEEVIVLSKFNTYSAFLNGNMMSISNGYVSNGTCAGDYIYWTGFAMPSDQNGCTDGTGVAQHTLIWSMFQIIGICNSVCYGKGIIDLNPAISNTGPVY